MIVLIIDCYSVAQDNKTLKTRWWQKNPTSGHYYERDEKLWVYTTK